MNFVKNLSSVYRDDFVISAFEFIYVLDYIYWLCANWNETNLGMVYYLFNK